MRIAVLKSKASRGAYFQEKFGPGEVIPQHLLLQAEPTGCSCVAFACRGLILGKLAAKEVAGRRVVSTAQPALPDSGHGGLSDGYCLASTPVVSVQGD